MDENNKDSYEENLEENIKILRDCQQEHNLNSCMPCEIFLDCSKRNKYVKAVYESMSKGEDGNFDFN